MTEEANSAVFVWTKMQTESGMSLPAILAIKEIERLAGNGVFWWGVGNLPKTVREQAQKSDGTLPVLFSIMLSQPHVKDTHPSGLRIWTKYKDAAGPVDLPAHVLEFSRDYQGSRNHHYALVCHSHMPLAVTSHGAFDPTRYTNFPSGKPLADSQTTALLKGNLYEDHPQGKYHFRFRATLVKPWAVKLVSPLRLPLDGSHPLFDGWKQDWKKFVARIRNQDAQRGTQ